MLPALMLYQLLTLLVQFICIISSIYFKNCWTQQLLQRYDKARSDKIICNGSLNKCQGLIKWTLVNLKLIFIFYRLLNIPSGPDPIDRSLYLGQNTGGWRIKMPLWPLALQGKKRLQSHEDVVCNEAGVQWSSKVTREFLMAHPATHREPPAANRLPKAQS